MRPIGNRGRRSPGPTGFPVPGWITGAGGFFMSARTLYHVEGIDESGRVILFCIGSS
jgi:hypothetical protein